MITVHNRGRVRIKLSTNYDAVEISEPLSKFISHVALREANEKKNYVTISFKVLTMQQSDWFIKQWNRFTWQSCDEIVFFLCWMVCVGSMRAIECLSWSNDLAKELAIAAKLKQIKLFESELNCWICEFVECSSVHWYWAPSWTEWWMNLLALQLN